uniref:ISXO2-like transposase domain-containing protein n=1 Tax=Octopus bimaculoides TaxID=37653 RepID=A0A0L8GJF1_OCTBM
MLLSSKTVMQNNETTGTMDVKLMGRSDCQYFCVEQCDRNSLIQIIERECEKGSLIHSDEWSAYNNLNAIGYHHVTVNHQRHYVDPVTKAHTQAIQ